MFDEEDFFRKKRSIEISSVFGLILRAGDNSMRNIKVVIVKLQK